MSNRHNELSRSLLHRALAPLVFEWVENFGSPIVECRRGQVTQRRTKKNRQKNEPPHSFRAGVGRAIIRVRQQIQRVRFGVERCQGKPVLRVFCAVNPNPGWKMPVRRLDNVTAGSKSRSGVAACLVRRVSAFAGKAHTRKAKANAKSQPASPACLRRQCRTIVSGAIIAPNINQGQQRLHRLRVSHTFSLQAKSPSLDQRRRPRQFLSGDRQNFRR